MRINIINLDKERWILTKISKKLAFHLTKLGHTVFLSKKPRADVDINHFIIFLFQKEDKKYYPKTTINTTMLTHVNDDFRYKKLKNISQFIDAGIAFSNHHKKFIEKKSLGLKKVFYVLPPTDDDVELKPVDEYVKEPYTSENISEYYDMQITLVNVQAKNRKVKIEVS